MPTEYPELFAALARPFGEHEVKVRSAQGGRQLHYVTARTIMNRLDEVLGPEFWQDKYTALENGVLCELTVELPNGKQVTKSDAGGFAGMADQGDDEKSGHSDAFKRAAAKFGCARYLYRDGVPRYVEELYPDSSPPAESPPARQAGGYDRPANPPVAPREQHDGGHAPRGQAPAGKYGNPPRSGKAMFAWVKGMEEKYEVGLLKYLNAWSRDQDFPARMIDWEAEQVALAHAEACRKLDSIQTGDATDRDN